MEKQLINKKCASCSIELSTSLFSKCNNPKKSKDGFQSSCKPCMKSYQQKRYIEKKQEIDNKNKEWYNNNREARIASTTNYTNERAKIDPLFKLIRYLRSRTKRAMRAKRMHKNCSFNNYIGCNPVELRKHIENQFKPDMSWNNYGKWHLDHKIPLSSAKTEKEIYILSHYTNLQPLWAHENLIKSDKVA